MKKYDIFLFDADGTLYDFDKTEANALKTMFDICGFDYSESTLTIYKKINVHLWNSYEIAGRIYQFQICSYLLSNAN
jgi:2-haloacid dehalogenase